MNDTKKIWWICLVVITTIMACRKEEFMPDPQGEKIAYTEVDSTLQQLLGKPEYVLFNKAWRKSNVSNLLAGWGASAPFTLLVPDEAAMRAAGLDDAGIEGASKEMLDSMLMFHVLIGNMNNNALNAQNGSIAMRTLLLNPIFGESLNPPGTAVKRDSIYRYQQYIALSNDGQLIVNGRVSGNASAVVAKNGTLWKINRVLKPARKNMREVLEGDARFTLYLEALRIADSIYTTIEGLDIASSVNYMFYSRTFNTSYLLLDYDCWCYTITYGQVERNSLFAPTNEAFIKAGLRTVDDIRALSGRSKPMYIDYQVVGYGALDSLLSMNAWGRQRDVAVAYITPMFFSNDLAIPSITMNFPLKTVDLYASPTPSPLEFSKDGNGRIQVQWKGSSAEKATVIESDIETVQGPIHVIDRLIVRPGFHF